MIRHVVVWKLSSDDPDTRRGDAAGIRERLERLVGVVPGLVTLQVSADLGASESNWDVLLLSEHDDAAALERYQTHPEHLEAAAFIRGVVRERACVDVPA